MQDKNNFINPITGKVSITQSFGENLAKLLSEKIVAVHESFPTHDFCKNIKEQVIDKSYTQRIEIIADNLKQHLPEKYTDALSILMQIIGPENEQETGMFTNFYWLMPVAKFIQKFGLDHFTHSVQAIEEVTKRNTGEYAIRPYARKYPDRTLAVCKKWAQSKNFHLRRLASEGLRPKLPWAPKLYIWNDEPELVFEILEILKEDESRFVKKSVANHLRDWIKVNPIAASKKVTQWSKSKNENTLWILKHAQR